MPLPIMFYCQPSIFIFRPIGTPIYYKDLPLKWDICLFSTICVISVMSVVLHLYLMANVRSSSGHNDFCNVEIQHAINIDRVILLHNVGV